MRVSTPAGAGATAIARPSFSTAAVPGTLFFPDNGDGGFTGGGQIGYNYQIGSFVIGLETDIQWADTDQGEDVAFIPTGAPGTFVPGDSTATCRIGSARCGPAPVSRSTASWSTPPAVWPTPMTPPAGWSAAASSGLCR